ncbi:MAG: hypothetical protein HY717_12515 [Planctomycetes bacterium]|nr:hypothetical protein [Planctomycetota bacterium]
MCCDFLLFEFGSTSLKFYYRLSPYDRVEEYKIPWLVSHEVFQTGRISRETTIKAICALRALLSTYGRGRDPEKIVAFATGVFREAQNALEFTHQIWSRAGIKLAILSEDQEAALLKSLCLSKIRSFPVFAFDLGGGSLQWVLLESREDSARGSIGLGSIRLLKMASDAFDNFIPALGCEIAGKYLANLPRVGLAQVVGTGGTVKALSLVAGKRVVRRDELEALVEKVRRFGPPEQLRPHRQSIFLPGLVLLQQLLREIGAGEICHCDLSIGKALLQKVLAFHDQGDGQPHPSQILKHMRYSAVLPVGE